MVTRFKRTLAPAETDRVIRGIYCSTMLYGVGEILFVNSFMLLYFSILGVPSERILLYLALPMLIRIFTLVPFAHWAERIGKVMIGVLGLSLSTSSMVVLALAGYAHQPFVEPLIIAGVVLYGCGYGMYLNSWYPLLSPIIPEARRGRFFGTMRLLYQSAAIAFTFVVAWTLERQTAIGVFQFFLATVVALRIGGIILYGRIPDLERLPDTGRTLWQELLNAVGKQGYLPFCSYVFLLSLFTGACPSLFSLLAKDTLGLGEGQVMLIGNLTTFGALIGFFYGGTMVDKMGTKHVFLACHFSYAIVLGLFLLRGFLPVPLVLIIGGLALCFGLVQAASGVAISSEMLALIPADNKPMASAVNLSLMSLGISLSGVFCSRILKLGMLSPSWTLFGKQLGPYDSLLCCCGVMVMLLVVTLGLVPSVVKKVQWE